MSRQIASDPPVQPSAPPSSRGRWLRVGKATGLTFLLLTVGLTAAAYSFGDGHVWIGDRTISDMNPFEVTSASAVGAAGLVVGLGAVIVALLAALVATVLSLALGLLGAGLGLFVTVGVATGPILLAVIIGVLVKRRYYPDVI